MRSCTRARGSRPWPAWLLAGRRGTSVWGDSWIRLQAGALSKLLSLRMGTGRSWNLLDAVHLMGKDPASPSVLQPRLQASSHTDIWCNSLFLPHPSRCLLGFLSPPFLYSRFTHILALEAQLPWALSKVGLCLQKD